MSFVASLNIEVLVSGITIYLICALLDQCMCDYNPLVMLISPLRNYFIVEFLPVEERQQ